MDQDYDDTQASQQGESQSEEINGQTGKYDIDTILRVALVVEIPFLIWMGFTNTGGFILSCLVLAVTLILILKPKTQILAAEIASIVRKEVYRLLEIGYTKISSPSSLADQEVPHKRSRTISFYNLITLLFQKGKDNSNLRMIAVVVGSFFLLLLLSAINTGDTSELKFVWGMYSLLGIAVGIFLCFYGYIYFQITLAISGFIVGFITLYVFFILTQVPALAGFIGGVIGAAACYYLYYVGVFAVGYLFGVEIGFIISILSMFEVSILIGLVLGLITGIAALIFQKFAIIVSTAFSGAWNIASGIAFFVGIPLNIFTLIGELGNPYTSPEDLVGQYVALIIGTLLLAMWGIQVQYGRDQKASSQADNQTEV